MKNYIGKTVLDYMHRTPAPFGFGLLSHVVYKRTYSRWGEEEWRDTVYRVINGTANQLVNMGYWDEGLAERWATDSARQVFDLKWSPPGRGLQMMGTDFIHGRGIGEALLNCAFISTERLGEDGGRILAWIAKMLMLGCGVGADLKGAGRVFVYDKSNVEQSIVYAIPDSREGWAESVAMLFDSYTNALAPNVEFDYSKIRPRGAPIHGFGGTASGPEPLIELHRTMREALTKNASKPLEIITLADIINAIGVCVVSGNIRRSAIILFGDNDATYLNLKNYDMFPYRESIGWTSNNSVFASKDMDYDPIAERILDNGEPGLLWLENVSRFGRTGDYDAPPDNAMGSNPCGEIPLHSYEMCNLTEIYLPRITSEREWYDVLRNAYLYAKGVSIMYEMIQDDRSREVMLANRRIGISVTGITMALASIGENRIFNMLNNGYAYLQHLDSFYSSAFGIPRSIRLTTVKPSGTVSLVAGVTPGVHYPIGRYHIRRVRVAEDTKLADELIQAGVSYEPDLYSPNTLVFSFPVDLGVNVKGQAEASIEEKISVVKMVQLAWADNSVSVTVSFDPKNTTASDIASAIRNAHDDVKTLTFLPDSSEVYPQMPYERITAQEYARLTSHTRDAFRITADMHIAEKYCTTDVCAL